MTYTHRDESAFSNCAVPSPFKFTPFLRCAERVVCEVVSRMPSGGAASSAATQLRSCAAVAPVSAMITWPWKLRGRSAVGSFARITANICAVSTGTTLTTSLRGYSGKLLGFFTARGAWDSPLFAPPCPHAHRSVPASSAAPSAPGHDFVMAGFFADATAAPVRKRRAPAGHPPLSPLMARFESRLRGSGYGDEPVLVHGDGRRSGSRRALRVRQVQRAAGEEIRADEVADRHRNLVPHDPLEERDFRAHQHRRRNQEHVHDRVLEAQRVEDRDGKPRRGDLADGRARSDREHDGQADEPVAQH